MCVCVCVCVCVRKWCIRIEKNSDRQIYKFHIFKLSENLAEKQKLQNPVVKNYISKSVNSFN